MFSSNKYILKAYNKKAMLKVLILVFLVRKSDKKANRRIANVIAF